MSAWNNAVPSRDALRDIKREALLRAAAAAFNEKGFHGTSLDDIAGTLGLTKAALYHYFPNKHSLLLACFRTAMDVAGKSLARAREQGRSGRERLALCLKGYLNSMIDELSCCVVLMEENALLPADQAAIIRQRDRFERSLRDLVREGIEDGSIVPCDPKFIVFTLLGAMNWVPKWFRSDGDWTAHQLSEAFGELIERMLGPKPAARLTGDVRSLPPGVDKPAAKPVAGGARSRRTEQRH